MVRWFRSLLVAVLVTALLSYNAAAQGSLEEEVNVARAACNAGRLQEGLDKLAAIYVRTQDPNVLHNQGFCYEENGKLDEAISKFRNFLQAATDLPVDERAEVEKHIKELEGRAKRPQLMPAPPPEAPSAVATSAPPETPLLHRPLFWVGTATLITVGVLAALLLSNPSVRPADVCRPPECLGTSGVSTR